MSIRLDKLVCHHTGISRAEAKIVLRRGEVAVNKKIVKDGRVKVTEHDDVELNGQTLGGIQPRYFMLNKRAGTICSTQDEEYPSVLHDLELANLRGLHFAGRLDVDTTGLVLITDDGQWSHNITSPKKSCGKVYRVWLEQPLTAEAESALKSGIELHGEREPTKPAEVTRIGDKELLLTITEGRYHQVKRMFAALDNRVIKLHREKIGKLSLDTQLAPGEWRSLNLDEICSIRDE